MRVDRPATPWQFVEDNDSEYRLVPVLRDAAQTQNATEILASSVASFVRAARSVPADENAAALARALADLSVTGRVAYQFFRNEHQAGWNIAALKAATRAQLGTPAVDAELDSAIEQAFDRAYAVAWALCGPPATRAALRPSLGWIAVSAEDDRAHVPVNMPSPPYEQHEIDVTCGNVAVATRLFIASAGNVPAAPVIPAPRTLPGTPELRIPDDHQVLLFLHGHSSGAEEALDIIPHLLAEGLKRGTKYSVISFDLPNNGYSDTFDHTQVAATSDTTFPRLLSDNGPITTPVLDFIEEFVVAFVEQLDTALAVDSPKVTTQLAAVIGGSLGGNLGLRLGRRASMPAWLNRAIVAWSPASVWQPFAKESPKYLAPNHCFAECDKAETAGSRLDYFQQVYDKEAQPGIVKQQTKYWYRRDWELTDHHITLSRMARREIYNPHYRRWHWRVAGEQLIYSHFANESYRDSSTPIRHEKNTVRTLLVAGEADNYLGTKIYVNTARLGREMPKARGRMLRVRDTGHSIHIERPEFFAHEIVKFLHARVFEVTCITRAEGRIQSVRVTNQATQEQLTMPVEDCMAAIDAGDEFFVSGADGAISDVTTHGSGAGRFIAAQRNTSRTDNLLALKDC